MELSQLREKLQKTGEIKCQKNKIVFLMVEVWLN